jgi:thioredoxin reductase (NADPH)
MTGDDVVRDVAIIGSGPAGYTAAIYAARAQLHPLVFEGSLAAGGALMTTSEVENYPGFPDAILGPELIERLREQAGRFGVEFVKDDVSAVELTGDAKVLYVGEQRYLARTVIIATGSRYRELGLANERRLAARGVSYCATCDGFFFRDQDVIVVGGGDSALEEATYLTRTARTVTVVHRRTELRASRIMRDRAFDNPKITFRWNSEVADILGEDEVTGVVLRDTGTGAQQVVPTSGIFVAIGHEPRTELFRGQLELSPTGHVIIDAPSSRTNLSGVFACGDVADPSYMQAITAAGTGCVAALDAERHLAASPAQGHAVGVADART